MADQPRTLKATFAEANSLRQSSTTSNLEETLQTAILRYEECLRIASEVSLFSPNESLEDVSSSDLQYFLIHYNLADLLQRLNTARNNALVQARHHFEEFLKLLSSYDILSKADAGLYARYAEDRERFSTASTTDAAARRNTKIQRFKEEKALKQKLEFLEKNPSIASTDDDTIRELHLTSLQLRTHETFQSLESIGQELEILSLAPPVISSVAQPDDRQRRKTTDEYSERLDQPYPGLTGNGPILDPKGKPLRPFTLLDKRSQLQQGVFRPGHNLPTMSIDEYLEEERKRGGIIEGGGPQSGIKPYVDEDDVNVADAETLKARAWDDFKDDNPRGAGNTMNMG